MRVTTVLVTLFFASTEAFSTVPTCRTQSASVTSTFMANPLDAMNQQLLNDKDDDDDVPMTKAEMRTLAKEMKAEVKRLKDEAAAAAKAEAEE
mmetsp:Transcript_10216/g.11679  ORF Transcript_10216/g.11679 Transcript_10216/m.11679 type:complete len:93 (-) Transcript_10216:54-332(-)|eukprot:CAMPEP_0171295222 /NCGR_PEP_ID=MMETSP0816-20121228/3837_1 /TAXON_ID=420281 /ORGANISM="Proboscia inermis, Strain CCAP1064/1" /LENGTH=92 /DNA_ID=CAMNT_0011767739 /DNA_START=130 /DNA_END=408 /DNA_ORIENTATION=-